MNCRQTGIGLIATMVVLSVALTGCGGGGTSGTAPTVSVNVQNAQWVAFQDGANGNWTTLAPSSGFSGAVPSSASDGRYSLAFVCGGTKPTVYVVHATRQELPQASFTCAGAAPSSITVSGTVSGLSGGQALVSIGETATATTGTYDVNISPGTYDALAVRIAGSVPNRVWLQRNRQFANNTTYNINFDQPDGTIVRVFDVSSGTLTVSGLDTLANETATVRILFQSGNRVSVVGVGSALNEATPTAYPRFPSGILGAAEQFRVVVDTSEQRGVVQVAASLPDSLTITLPPPM